MRLVLNLIALIVLTIPSLLAAQEENKSTKTVEVTVEIAEEPVKVLGFILKNGDTEQVGVTEWKRVNDRILLAYVPVTNLGSETTVTAMVIGERGAIKYGDVRKADSLSSIYSLPECSTKSAPKNLANQTGLVQALVDVRTARRNYLELKLAKTLDEQLIDTLTKLEKGFGIQSTEIIDPTLHPTVLADRLLRIEAAIVNYRSKKAAK